MTITQLDAQTGTLNLAVAAEVRAWCARKKITQRDLAASLGTSTAGMSARFNGKTPFTFAELMATAALMNISLADLLGSGLVNEKDPQHFAEGLSVGSGAGTRSRDLTIMSRAL